MTGTLNHRTIQLHYMFYCLRLRFCVSWVLNVRRSQLRLEQFASQSLLKFKFYMGRVNIYCLLYVFLYVCRYLYNYGGTILLTTSLVKISMVIIISHKSLFWNTSFKILH